MPWLLNTVVKHVQLPARLVYAITLLKKKKKKKIKKILILLLVAIHTEKGAKIQVHRIIKIQQLIKV